VLGGRAGLLTLFGDPFGHLRRLYATYGEIVALARGDPPYVVAFGPHLNQQLLAHAEVFENSAGPFFARLPKETALGRLLVNNLPVMNGAAHRQQRRLMQPSFHKQQIAAYHRDMVALTEGMLARLHPGAELELLAEMKRLTQHIAVTTLFGMYNEAELDRVGALLKRAIDLSQSPLALLAPYKVVGLPFHRANRMAEQLERYIRTVAERKRTQPDATDVLATLVRARDEDGAVLSDAALIGNAFTLFVAGHETTSNALTWTVFLLDQHPQILADLVDELQGVLGGRAPAIEDVARLPLLEGVIKESLRMLPPAPIGIRVAAVPCELGGYALPRGANVIFSEFVTHRIPELYEHPDRFNPRRWETLHPSPYEYLPFAQGRICALAGRLQCRSSGSCWRCCCSAIGWRWFPTRRSNRASRCARHTVSRCGSTSKIDSSWLRRCAARFTSWSSCRDECHGSSHYPLAKHCHVVEIRAESRCMCLYLVIV
jgi:cytochrome P450